MLTLQIYGKPEPAVHHRGFGRHSYNPKGIQQERVRWQMKSQFHGELITYPIKVEMFFFLKVPKHLSCIRRKEMLAQNISHDKRPDTSNLFYFYENCLKGVVITDDCIIRRIEGEKLWGIEEKVTINIHSIYSKGFREVA